MGVSGIKDSASSRERRLSRKRLPNRGKKPKFRRQESWRYKRVKENWRFPRGIDSKMRKKVKGWPASPNIGYRSPRKSRGIHPSGYEEVRVANVEQLEQVDPASQAVRISRTVGAKRRFEVISQAEERGIHVLNPRRVEEPEETRIEEIPEHEEEAKTPAQDDQ